MDIPTKSCPAKRGRPALLDATTKAGLARSQQLVVSLRTLETLRTELHLSKERIRQLEAAAYAKLRKSLAAEGAQLAQFVSERRALSLAGGTHNLARGCHWQEPTDAARKTRTSGDWRRDRGL